MLLLANADQGIMKHKTNKYYTDHHIQDELIKLTVTCIELLRTYVKAACYFAVEADEVTDSSYKEQVVVVCVRWVDDKFKAHKDL